MEPFRFSSGTVSGWDWLGVVGIVLAAFGLRRVFELQRDCLGVVGIVWAVFELRRMFELWRVLVKDLLLTVLDSLGTVLGPFRVSNGQLLRQLL